MESAETGGPRPLAYPRSFFLVVAGIFAADQLTKLAAVDLLTSAYVPRPVLGDLLRFTLVYNPGAAFGLHLGSSSRWIFMGLTAGALVLLSRLYVETRPGDFVRTFSIALVSGGAMGNLLDRIRSARGVVDFIDVGIGSSRWPTFNVADMAVSVGAILLAWILWREDVERHRAAGGGDAAAAAGSNEPDAPVRG